MKVVINKCYGGFGISVQALAELIYRQAEGVEKHPINEWYDKELPERYKEFGKYKVEHFDDSMYDDEYVYTWDRSNRTDPKLIMLIEEKGSDWVSDRHANLKIVEIPDDVDWQIEEYDGMEWIAEVHRTWS